MGAIEVHAPSAARCSLALTCTEAAGKTILYDLLGPVDARGRRRAPPYVSGRVPGVSGIGADEPRASERHAYDGTRGQFLARGPEESALFSLFCGGSHSPQRQLLPTGHERSLAWATVPQRPQKTRAHRRQ